MRQGICIEKIHVGLLWWLFVRKISLDHYGIWVIVKVAMSFPKSISS
jgi:hypothetical protein